MTDPSSSPLLPGEDLVRQGLLDLAQNRLSDCALLVLIASSRLRELGFQIEDRPALRPYEHRLFEQLEERLGPAAHSHYNSLIRRIVSYARALAREQRHLDG